MALVKIECACGQHYAFDIEPVNGRMPQPVACPACGAHGTEAANAFLQANQPVAPPTPRLHAATARTPAARMAGARLPVGSGVNPDQVKTDARAKLLWGDSQEEVTKYLRMNGFAAPEAAALVREMAAERRAALRQKGFRKTMLGVGLIGVPVATYIFMASVGIFSFKLLGVALAVGLYGCWLLLDGAIMALSPGSERGNVAER